MNKSQVRLKISLVGLVLCWFVGMPLTGHADMNEARTLFEVGNAAYAAGEFEQAIASYESLLTEYSDCSTEYNLGNAHFKAGHLGEAILHYERAKSLCFSGSIVWTDALWSETVSSSAKTSEL